MYFRMLQSYQYQTYQYQTQSQDIDWSDWRVYLIIGFFVVFIAGIMWYQNATAGKIPQELLDRYAGKIKAQLKVKGVSMLITDESIVVNSGYKWYAFDLTRIGYIATARGRKNMPAGFSFVDKDGKSMGGEIVAGKAMVNASGKFIVTGTYEKALAIQEFVVKNVPGVEEK